MAENIDSLQIEISADTAIAEKSINKLISSISKLQKKLDVDKLKIFTTEIKSLSSATNGLDGTKLSVYAEKLADISRAVSTFSESGKKIKDSSAALEKLSNLDFSKLSISGDFSGFKSLSEGMEGFSKAAVEISKIKPTEINRAVKGLGKLESLNLSNLAQNAQMLKGVDFSALNDLGTGVQALSTSLAGADKVSAGTTKLFSSLSMLAASANNIPKIQQALPRLSVELQGFISTMAQAPSVQASTTALITALSNLASAGNKIQKTVSALPDLTQGIGQFINALSKMPKVNDNTLRAVEALSRIAPVGAKAGSAAKSLQKNIASLSSSMGKLQSGTKASLSGLKGFAMQAAGLIGIAGGIYALIGAAKESITTASDLAEAQNVVNQGFGDMAYMANDFASTSLQTFGISEVAAKRTAGQFAVMGKALGLVPEEAAKMSLSLTGLTGDLSSFWNVSQDVAQTALESVFTGETESLKQFGVVLTEANLQQFAYSQGITQSISAMTEAEKVQLRYAYVMQATSDAQGDFAATSGGWANQVRLLSGQFQTLAGIVGTGLIAAFLPVIQVVNNVMSKIIQLANTLGTFLGKLFGIQSQTSSMGAGLSEIAESAGSVSDNLGSAAGEIGDVGKEASKSEDKLNGFIAGWHEVNNMTSNEGSKGSGGGGGAGGGVAMPDMALPSEYEIDLTAEDQISPVIEAVKNRAIELKSLFLAGFSVGLGDTSVFDSIQNNIDSIGKSFLDIFANEDVITAFNSMIDTLSYNAGAKAGSFISVGSTIIDNITGGAALYLESAKERIQEWLVDMFNITARTDTIITNFQVALADIFTVFRSDEAKQITADIIQIFTDGFMGTTELAAKLGADILNVILTPITENAEGFKEELQNVINPISEVLTTLADSFTQTWDKINQMYDEHLRPLFDSITDGLSEIVGTLLDGYNTYMAPVLETLAGKFTEVWQGTIQPLLDNFIELFGKVADLIKVVWENILQPVVNWIAGNIYPVVAPVVEAVGTLFLDVFQGIGDTLNNFLTIAGGVIDFLTGVFSGDWEKAWDGIKSVFEGVWNGMPDFIKEPIRSIVGFINTMIAAVESGVNGVIEALNAISIDIPETPFSDAFTLGFNLSKIDLPRIPQLAKGGVLKKGQWGFLEGDGDEAVVPLEKNTGWISAVAENLKERLGHFENLKVDIMPEISKHQYAFSNVDVNSFRNQRMSDEIDFHMAALSGQISRQNRLIEEQNELLEAIYKKPTLSSREAFEAVTKEWRLFARRTHKSPVPLY